MCGVLGTLGEFNQPLQDIAALGFIQIQSEGRRRQFTGFSQTILLYQDIDEGRPGQLGFIRLGKFFDEAAIKGLGCAKLSPFLINRADAQIRGCSVAPLRVLPEVSAELPHRLVDLPLLPGDFPQLKSCVIGIIGRWQGFDWFLDLRHAAVEGQKNDQDPKPPGQKF